MTRNITNKGQEISHFPSGAHKAAMNRRGSMTNTSDPQKKYRLGTVSKNILMGGGGGINRVHGVPTSALVQMWIKTHRCLVCMNVY